MNNIRKGRGIMDIKIECSTCAYWCKTEDTKDGECRVDRPTPILVPVPNLLGAKPGIGISGFFPQTRPDIWCGRHSDFVTRTAMMAGWKEVKQ